MQPRHASMFPAVRPDGRAAEIGAMSGARTLDAAVIHRATDRASERIALRAGSGVVLVRLSGVSLAHFDAIDRDTGAGFVDALADWLGTPLGPPVAAGPSRTLRGTFARRGVFRDRSGADWETVTLVVGGAMVILRISGARAQLVEVARAHREPLVVAIDRALGHGRPPSTRATLRLANAHLSLPATWLAACPDRTFAGGRWKDHARAVDPCDRVALELTCATAVLDPTSALAAEVRAPVVARDRGDLALAWHEDGFDDGGPACSRLLVASNGHASVIATYAYWLADAPWAIAEWERIVSTIELRTA